jgi:hypothetical protein
LVFVIDEAIKISIMYRLDMKDMDVAINPLSLWRLPKRHYRPSEVESQLRIWTACMFMDASTGIVSSIPLIIDDTRYLYTLEPRPTVELNESEKEGAAMYKKLMEEGIEHALGGVGKRGRVVEDHSDGWLLLFQLSYIARRITRLNYMTEYRGRNIAEEQKNIQSESLLMEKGKEPMDPNGRIKELVDILPKHESLETLHNILMSMYHSFPSEFKPWNHLMELAVDKSSVRLSESFDVSRNVNIYPSLMFLTALTALHLPQADCHLYFNIGPKGGQNMPVTSSQIILLARRAQGAILRKIAQFSDTLTPHEQLKNTVRVYMNADLFQCFHIFTMAAASLAVAGFSKNEEASREVKDIIEDVQEYNLPALDSIGEIWYINILFSLIFNFILIVGLWPGFTQSD